MAFLQMLTRHCVHPGFRHSSLPLMSPTNVVPILEACGGLAASVGSVRGKKSMGGGTTRNKAGFPKGKKRGPKVYDGQRIQVGTLLVSQTKLHYLPGWNVCFGGNANLKAVCHGRVMFTVEKCDLKFDHDKVALSEEFPQHSRSRNIFKTHVHVIPDEQHQYFRLTEQI